jgi:hypothetical protein
LVIRPSDLKWKFVPYKNNEYRPNLLCSDTERLEHLPVDVLGMISP